MATDSSRLDDHVVKPRECAKAGAPLFMVVDPFTKTVRLLSNPSEEGYQTETKVKFGDRLELPAPWNLTLDTSRFPAA
ncbi:Uma2 family endonuclease [Bailinhaonella thermotolerans]|uniref:Uma2 family endonuclease n=1 Tax=Bailinhaonella thermotolerans TaxID=1070861 RepID=A0A3A4AC28_9ACTN|nr:Uma2 family endonuclease [Bailinhaonella thermotolerans]RJL23580.1 Uma2 family endonuclease [Bailinhaonella thermotolerans]